MIHISDEWACTYPGAKLGIMTVQQAANPEYHEQFHKSKLLFEDSLRRTFTSREQIASYGPIPAYIQYYKKFNKTYHVSAQIESVAMKGKSVPRVAALVEAMFLSELKSGLLTAGHDLEMLQQPLSYGIAGGSEVYTMMNGQEQNVKSGDMILADADGVIGSIIYGPDMRTRITPKTKDVLFVIYAPPGIDTAAIDAHLDNIIENTRLISPQAVVEFRNVFEAVVP